MTGGAQTRVQAIHLTVGFFQSAPIGIAVDTVLLTAVSTRRRSATAGVFFSDPLTAPRSLAAEDRLAGGKGADAAGGSGSVAISG